MVDVTKQRITFKASRELLVGQIITDRVSAKPQVLFLHGGGCANKERTDYLSFALARRQIPSLSFDFSGHGESEGHLINSSLKKRVDEALAATAFLSNSAPLTVCGSSMGAHIALRLLEHKVFRTVLLFCPAVYDRRAFRVRFGKDFSAVIRQEMGWRHTEVLSNLRAFTGNLLICVGEMDSVIPPGVIDIIDMNATKARNKEIIRIPEASHQLHTWLSHHTSVANHVIDKVVQLCT
jgi:pimeloyl-ACP methyl ester carboxylesterase